MENQIKVRAFGMVAENLGKQELFLENPGNSDRLLEHLNENYPDLKEIKFSLAVNKKLCTEPSIIPIGAEVAILPPFSGG
jgi:molybdopterin converting factor small subunit